MKSSNLSMMWYSYNNIKDKIIEVVKISKSNIVIRDLSDNRKYFLRKYESLNLLSEQKVYKINYREVRYKLRIIRGYVKIIREMPVFDICYLAENIFEYQLQRDLFRGGNEF